MADYQGTNYGDISPRVGIYRVGKMLAHAEPILVLAKMGTAIRTENLPGKTGLTIKWRRPVPFTADTTSLVEGVRPPLQVIQYDDVTATIKQYGKVVGFTDVIADIHEDPVLSDMTTLLSEQMANTVELLTWNEIRACSTVLYSNGSAVTDVNTPLDRDVIDSAVRTLEANHAKKITTKIVPGPNYATSPVRPAFVLVTHTDQRHDIERLEGYIPCENYADGGRNLICEQEIGSVGNVRIVISPQLIARTGAGSATTNGMVNNGTAVNVYTSVIFGQEAFAVTYLKGMSGAPKINVRNPAMGTVGDELGQTGAVSAKFWFVARILSDSWMLRIESAVTSL